MIYSLLNFHHNVILNRNNVLHFWIYEYHRLLNQNKKFYNIFLLIDPHLSSTKYKKSIQNKNSTRIIILSLLYFYVYIYVYVYMLSLRRVIASACATGVISIMVGDDQHVDYRWSWSELHREDTVSPIRYVFLFTQSACRIGMMTFYPTTEW